MEYNFNNIEDKFAAMISSLKQLSEKVEMIAEEIDNENLKNAMRLFATETFQYAEELKAESKQMNITKSLIDFTDLMEEVTANFLPTVPEEKGNEVLSFCVNCENFFQRMYKEFLKDFLYNNSLANIIDGQLLGIKSAFMRIKRLNAIRFNH